MIPKIIHYCWFGQNELPPLAVACIESWKKYLPDYEVMRWDETNSPTNEFIKFQLEQGNWAFASDYVRLQVLHTYGGVYLDTDVEVIRSFDSLLSYSGFLAYEEEGRITNGVAAAEKGHPFFLDCMNYMMQRFQNDLAFEISPVVTTTVFNSKSYDIEIFENKYFYPYNPYDRTIEIKILMYSMITENTFAIHHWAKSWGNDEGNKDKGVGLCACVYRVCSYLTRKLRQLKP